MLSPLYRSTISFHFLELKQVYWQDESNHKNNLYPQNAVQHICSPFGHVHKFQWREFDHIVVISEFDSKKKVFQGVSLILDLNKLPLWGMGGIQSSLNVGLSRSVCSKATVNLGTHVIHSCPISVVLPCRFKTTTTTKKTAALNV